MALKSYVYQQRTGQPLLDACQPSLDPGTAFPVIVSSAATAEVICQYEETKKGDLDAAMAAEGWEYIATVP